MNLEINIKVPLGAPGVSIEQETSSVDSSEVPAPPPPPPELLVPPDTTEGMPNRLRPYLEQTRRGDGVGNGTTGDEVRAEAVDASPPSLEELGVEPEVVSEIAPPSPETLESEGLPPALPPGLEGLDMTGLETQTDEGAPPSLQELAGIAAEGAESPPSAEDLRPARKPRAEPRTRPKSRKTPTKKE